jgi:hypothetical protein
LSENNETPPFDVDDEGNSNVVVLDDRRKEEQQRVELEQIALDFLARVNIEVTKTTVEFFTSDYLINGYLLLQSHAKDNHLIKTSILKAKKLIVNHPNSSVGVIFESALKTRRLQQEAERQRRIAEIRQTQTVTPFDDYKQDIYASYDKNGYPLVDVINAQLAIKHVGVKASYNLFRDEPTWSLNDEPINVNALFNMIYEKTRVQFSIDKLEVALSTYAARRAFHPVKEYFDQIEHLEPQGIIDNWITRVFGAEDNLLNREIGKKMLVAMVARIYEPGTKFDQMIIFESIQGTGKSTVLELLVGTEFFNSGSLFNEEKAMAQTEAIRGIMLYESADLAGHKKADVDKVKAFLSKTNDRGRWVYDRTVKDFKRTAIIVGTTNSNAYLMDDTGNRRFWPVKCSVVKTNNIINGKVYADTDWMKENRNQLWAEALRLYRDGYSLVLDHSLWNEVSKLQAERVIEVAGLEKIPDIFGLSEAEGLHVFDEPAKKFLELRIFTKNIIEQLFASAHGNAAAGRIVKGAMQSYSHLDHELRWINGLLRIGRVPPANGYKMIAEGEPKYSYLKDILTACREERRNTGLGSNSTTL